MKNTFQYIVVEISLTLNNKMYLSSMILKFMSLFPGTENNLHKILCKIPVGSTEVDR